MAFIQQLNRVNNKDQAYKDLGTILGTVLAASSSKRKDALKNINAAKELQGLGYDVNPEQAGEYLQTGVEPQVEATTDINAYQVPSTELQIPPSQAFLEQANKSPSFDIGQLQSGISANQPISTPEQISGVRGLFAVKRPEFEREQNLKNLKSQAEIDKLVFEPTRLQNEYDLKERAAGLGEKKVSQSYELGKTGLGIDKAKADEIARHNKAMEEIGKNKAGKQSSQSLSPVERLAKLPGTEKNNVGSLASAFGGMEMMQKAYDKTKNIKFVDTDTPFIGHFMSDTDFTAGRKYYNEVVARIQTGAAISNQEKKDFAQMVPTSVDSPEMVKTKFKLMDTFIRNKLKAYGFTLEEAQQIGLNTKGELSSPSNINSSDEAVRLQAKRDAIIKLRQGKK